MAEQFSQSQPPNAPLTTYQTYILSQQPQTNRRSRASRPSNFTKLTSISFFKAGICHMCRGKAKLVYQCYKNYMATGCEKKFCLDCLLLVYKENIIDIVQKCDSWKCPFIKKICRCKACCLARRENETILELDPNQPVICSLKAKQKQSNQGEEQDIDEEIDENLRCMLKEKFRKLIEFNGQMISKFNTNLHKLNEEESRFYNKIIHSNLKVLDRLSKNMLANNAIIDE